MKMVRRFKAVVFFLCIVLTANAQQWKLKRIEGIFGIGTSNVYSDLGGNPNATDLLFFKDFTFRSTRPSVYGGLRYRIDQKSSVKFSAIYGFSKTEDFEGSRNELRGFSSTTKLFEFGGTYEYYFLAEQRRLRSAAMFNRRGMINNYSSLGAYVFSGMAGTLFKPHLEPDETRPGDKYKDNMGVTLAIPIGVGLKYIISDKWVFGYEIGYRQTFSDFLDGFESPSSSRPDVYWVSTFNLSYRITTSRRGLPLFLDKNWRQARF